MDDRKPEQDDREAEPAPTATPENPGGEQDQDLDEKTDPEQEHA